MRRLLLIVLLSLVLVPVVGAQSDIDVLVSEAFTAIVEAEEAGGDVDELLTRLNEAIDLQGIDPDEARVILERLVVEAEAARARGEREGLENAAVAIAKVVVLVGLAAGVWLRGDEYFWRLWRRTKEGYVVD